MLEYLIFKSPNIGIGIGLKNHLCYLQHVILFIFYICNCKVTTKLSDNCGKYKVQYFCLNVA